MARKRVTKEEKQQRHEWAMKQIDKGVGFSELASLISETWGCTRRNARHVVSLAHKEWMDVAFGAEDIDQRDLLFQCVARLERTARKAEESGNYACVIGCLCRYGDHTTHPTQNRPIKDPLRRRVERGSES